MSICIKTKGRNETNKYVCVVEVYSEQNPQRGREALPPR
jgi:hypothetical protein